MDPAAFGASAPLAVGLGLRPDTPAARILAVVSEVVPHRAIACLATVDRRAGDPGLVTAAATLAVPLRSYSAVALSEVAVPNPSGRTAAALGTASVAEAAALLAGRGELVLPRRTIDGIVIAAALYLEAR